MFRATADAVKAGAGSAAAALASQVRKAGKTVAAGPLAQPTVLTSGPGITRALERFERRILEELARIFNDSDGAFYFSLTGDLTNSMQRQTEGQRRRDSSQEEEEEGRLRELSEEEVPLWKRADDRFFFNKHLVQVSQELRVTHRNSRKGNARVNQYLKRNL